MHNTWIEADGFLRIQRSTEMRVYDRPALQIASVTCLLVSAVLKTKLTARAYNALETINFVIFGLLGFVL